MTIPAPDCQDAPLPEDFFPNALRAIVAHCVYGSKKHNPGEPVYWAFNKSIHHVEKAIGHLQRAGQTDEETGLSHTINGVWRAIAALETELIKAGAHPGPRVVGAGAVRSHNYMTVRDRKLPAFVGGAYMGERGES